MNEQRIVKPVEVSGFYTVHSIFDTIQGEGPFAGVPATFIRLWGCNLQCPGCDTDYTSISRAWSTKDLVAHLCASQHTMIDRLVVITGGEPHRQRIGPLVKALLDEGFRVQIETNGTLYTDGPWTRAGVTTVCSPKTGTINPQLRPFIDAYKYVLDADDVDPEDGLPIMSMSRTHGPAVARPPVGWYGPVYVQPLDTGDKERNHRNQEAAIASCLKYGYTLCLQLHKIIGME